MSQYNHIIESSTSTVVAEYIPTTKKSSSYQSEDQLEKEFIKNLQGLSYEYLSIKNEEDLINNLRIQLEKLNNYKFTNKEWDNLFKKYIANENENIKEKTEKLQSKTTALEFKKEDGTPKNIYLLDKHNIHNNTLQVINQYENIGSRKNRYDVTILVNGLPLVHIELKRRGIALKEAFNQIERYQNDSFWSNCGLYEYVQIFVISNGTHTKYYSNTTRSEHLSELREGFKSRPKLKTSNSFEFTSWWADVKNKRIEDLVDFTKTFFSKYTILNILTKYCVFTDDKLLLVMRPYQIAATEKILSQIQIANNYQKKLGTIEAGGYIWHTTGSGKTLTSFKAARLASELEYVNKVIFVVDRQDLDYQTMKEYDKFEKGAANATNSTQELESHLLESKRKIIITTIQKLNIFCKKYKIHSIYDSKVVLIFDECHRSQFGEFHKNITKCFKKYWIFGFTGTPIFASNSNSNNLIDLKTTEQAFGNKLHSYTIIDAINDGNVLPFRVEYVNTIKQNKNIEDMKVYDIDREEALLNDQRISKVVEYILNHFDQKTKRNEKYRLNEKRLKGFNSILCCSSIIAAKKFYKEFINQLKDRGDKLKIGIIYSCVQNENLDTGLVDEEDLDTINLDKSSRDFLDDAIIDYNKLYSSNFSTNSNGFQDYYRDVSKRMKKRELDLLIVVNMFLTGFDATTLNTLWVDKNLKLHGLLQAFSRTNRILNSIKTFGNIVCFRDLEENTNESVALFGDKNAKSIVILKTFKEYYNGYTQNGKFYIGYKELVNQLQTNFSSLNIIGETNEKEFIKLFGSILRLKNILSSFDEFDKLQILTDREWQDYQSLYLDLYNKIKSQRDTNKENINEDVTFEIELIKQVDINIDYIRHLVEKYHESNCKNKEILSDINKAITSSPALRNKKDLIDAFIRQINIEKNINWNDFVIKIRENEINKIITNKKLNSKETYKYIEECFRDGYIKENGVSISKILPPLSRFSKDNSRTIVKKEILNELQDFFDKYHDI